MKKLLKFNNTYEEGEVTFLIISKGKKYIGVCLEFDLIVEADNAYEAKRQIIDYAKVWHRNAVKNKLPEELLNRPAPKEFWEIFEKLVNQDKIKLEAEKQTSNVVYEKPPQFVGRFELSYPNFAFTY